ncbi:hypothetical protein [Ruegeria sp. HKCCSP351]|uniref:hypothetical protein n=1 Tax=Ruegeria sp. HKCCSP351 TaxID=2794832 RepID=UPI001FD83E18|nr:hypothetical protein [Ruegeria sp. HKCCSP351]
MTDAVLAVAVLLFVPDVAVAANDGERHPVNCATAEGDLRAIAAERKHAQDQQLESVAAITPAGALLGLVTGTEHKRLQMLSGDYINQLDARSAEIKKTCNLN